MSPEVAAAIERLRGEGALPPAQAALFGRVARRELVSVREELRALLYAGVLLVTAGAGLLVRQNLAAIGPAAIAGGLGLAAALALAWVARFMPRFSWDEVPSPNLAFDYILLLGVLLASADLAYIEVQFTPLGPAWPWHLLIVAVLSGLLAFRSDSRVLFSLALSTFAAWRGVSLSYLERGFWGGRADPLALNSVACGALFLVLGAGLARTGRKAHFEPVATYLGWILVLGGLAAGETESRGLGIFYEMALLAAGAGLAAIGFRSARYGLFVLGILGAYFGASGLVLERISWSLEAALWWFVASAGCCLAVLIAGRRAMRRFR